MIMTMTMMMMMMLLMMLTIARGRGPPNTSRFLPPNARTTHRKSSVLLPPAALLFRAASRSCATTEPQRMPRGVPQQTLSTAPRAHRERPPRRKHSSAPKVQQHTCPQQRPCVIDLATIPVLSLTRCPCEPPPAQPAIPRSLHSTNRDS